MNLTKKDLILALISILVSTIVSLVCVYISYRLGIFGTLYETNPKTVEQQYVANLAAVNAEIQGNQNSITTSIEPNVKEIITEVKYVSDKESNLAATSKMPELSTADFDQLTTSYYQLSPTLQASTTPLFNQIRNLYGQYNTLNRDTSLLNITIASSLGFVGTIFPPYLEYMKEQVSDSASSTIPIANNLYTEIPKLISEFDK